MQVLKVGCSPRLYAIVATTPYSISPDLPFPSTWTGPHRHLSLTRASGSSGLFLNTIILISPLTCKINCIYFILSSPSNWTSLWNSGKKINVWVMPEFNEFQSYIRNVASPSTSRHIHTHMQCPHFPKKPSLKVKPVSLLTLISIRAGVASVSIFWDHEMNTRSVIINRVSINSLG